MSNFKRTITTQKGHELMAKMLTGVTINFTRITTSEHEYSILEDFELEALTIIENEKQSVLVSDIELTNESYARVHSVITNTELIEGYYVKAICLYANDPSEGEILYSITVCESGKADWFPPFNEHNVSSIEVNLDTVISNADNVSLEVNPAALISVKTFNKFKDEITSQMNENVNILKSYDYLPNGTIPVKSGVLKNSSKLIRKISDNELEIFQKTNIGYLRYLFKKNEGDTSDVSVGSNWELLRLRKVEHLSDMYCYLNLTPSEGDIPIFMASGTLSEQEKHLIGISNENTTYYADDNTGKGFNVYNIANSTSYTFNIPITTCSKMNILFLSTNLSSENVDIYINDIKVKTINARIYRSNNSNYKNYRIEEIDIPSSVKSENDNFTLKIDNQSSSNPFYFCCFNFCKLHDYKNFYVNKFKAFGKGKYFINADGASDYAIQDKDLGKWCGSYHGGEISELCKISWILDEKNWGIEKHITTNFADIGVNKWRILNTITLLQRTNINSKGKMTSILKFDKDETIDMDFGFNGDINVTGFYTALTCATKTFKNTIYPVALTVIDDSDTKINANGMVKQIDYTNFLELTIRYTDFNKLNNLSYKRPFIRSSQYWNKFYYGAVIESNDGKNIHDLCFQKSMDFKVFY